MDMENIDGLMNLYIKEIGSLMSSTTEENILGTMAEDILANGAIT